MNIKTTMYKDHVEVEVMDGCLRLHAYSFADKNEAGAFCKGFSCGHSTAVSMVQFNLKFESKDRTKETI